jgi:hypothetical protein
VGRGTWYYYDDRMRNATILVVNLRGVATETIKNIVLAGIGKLIIWDCEDVAAADLGVGFFFREEDVGKKVRYISLSLSSPPLFLLDSRWRNKKKTSWSCHSRFHSPTLPYTDLWSLQLPYLVVTARGRGQVSNRES